MTFQEFLTIAAVVGAISLFLGALGKASLLDALVVLGALALFPGWVALSLLVGLVVGSWFLPAGERAVGAILAPPRFAPMKLPYAPTRQTTRPFNKRGR